jgi:hypothetical protein
MKTRVANINSGWSSIDLANELSGVDASAHIQARVGEYWTRVFNKRLVASLQGIQADSVANHGSDMIVDRKLEVFSYDHLVDAAVGLSENLQDLKILVVNPKIFGSISKEAKGSGGVSVEYRRIEELNMSIATYGGMALLVDSTLPVDSTDPDAPIYTSVVLGAGAFASAFGTPMNGLEIAREAAAGNGGGCEVVWSRVSPIIHPLGFDFTDSAVAGQSPTLAELADESNWSRLYARENVPIAFIESLA